ncbi:MAG TPA: sulfotransferase [Chiayiivirga sp.]|nr:sulfotransferase [Chiayiivirga sp.]
MKPSSSFTSDGLVALLQSVASLMQQGQLAQALAASQRAVSEYPLAPQAHQNLAQVASRLGQHQLALQHTAQAASLAPNNGQLQLALGCLLAHHGHSEDALIALQKSAELIPDSPEAWYFLGITLTRSHRHPEAIAALTRARGLAPAAARIRDALAEAHFQGGFPADALPLLRERVTTQPDDIDAVLKLGETLSRLQDYDDARLSFEQALQRKPAEPDLWMASAQAREDSGDRDAARAAYEQALRLRPDWVPALSGLLTLQRGEADAETLATAQRLIAHPDTSDRDIATLGYALGKVMDSRGEYRQAMNCWDRANTARKRLCGEFDLASLTERVERMLPAFDAGALAAAPASDEDRPLFIVGMPRSGTTLTEQILAAHPQVHGCGELPDIALIARHLPSQSGSSRIWPHIVDQIASADVVRARERYLTGASRHAPGTAVRLVDKAPMNFYALGLISLMFPLARIVWCQRDPRDVAISIYAENFSLGERFSTDLAAIGECIVLQQRLMRHWQKVLPNPILELDYQQLVTDPETQSRRLLEFAGLPWHDDCLAFHAGQRGVQTPSRWQVRQPIHTRSVGRWRNYEFALSPLMATLDAESDGGLTPTHSRG